MGRMKKGKNMNNGNKGTKNVMTVWMLKSEDLTEPGETEFSLWVDRKSALAAMEKDISEMMEVLEVDEEDSLERSENGATLDERMAWEILQMEVKGGTAKKEVDVGAG